MNFEDLVFVCDFINVWVKNEIRDMIDNLLFLDFIDGVFIKLVFVNVVYFKGLWKLWF